jgi:hypothetical protein
VRNNFLACIVAAGSVLLTPAPMHAQSAAAKATSRVPRTREGKPDFTGVWQPGSDKVGTWEEANQGVGVREPGQPSPRKVERPSYQPWAAAKVMESFNLRVADSPLARCIPQLDLGGQEGSLYPWQFVQTPDLIVILVESRHVFRLIPLNAKHPDDLDPSYLGDSVGHWEGDTLVVDVTGFKEILSGLNVHSDAMHITERFTRVDYNTINYEAKVEDPKALTKPYTIQSKIMLRPGTRLQEYVCEENNLDPVRQEQLIKEGLVKRN